MPLHSSLGCYGEDRSTLTRSTLTRSSTPSAHVGFATIVIFHTCDMCGQLLNLVVRKERPDLADLGEQLVEQQNGFKIKMKELEDNILYKLATAEGLCRAEPVSKQCSVGFGPAYCKCGDFE